MYRNIVFCSLLILSSQNFKITDDENQLFFCYPINSQQSVNHNNFNILCSGDECFGISNSNKEKVFTNMTVFCNTKTCKIIENTNYENEEGHWQINKKLYNYIEILITCFKGNCVGGFIQNNNQNNNGINKDNNYNIQKFSLNNPIIIFKCIDNVCNIIESNDTNENNIGISCDSCANNKCTFGINEEEKKDLIFIDKIKIIYIIIIIIIILIFILFIINYTICFQYYNYTCKCEFKFLVIILCLILFAPIIFLFNLFFICCERKEDKPKLLTSNDEYSTSDHLILNINKDDLSESESDIEQNKKVVEYREEKKRVIIQTHSEFSDIEKINGRLYS